MPPAKVSHPPLRDYALLAARILIAALFLVAAFNKLIGYSAVIGYFRKLGVPEPSMVAPAVVGFEVLAGLLLIVGYQTRLIALLVAGFCIVSGVLGHSQIGDPNNLNHLLKNLAIAGGALSLYVSGAGSKSLDGR
ncbi:MAG: DoxX family protein [Beijerinckiaceae bacterium]